jgi:hypothetical protein
MRKLFLSRKKAEKNKLNYKGQKVKIKNGRED